MAASRYLHGMTASLIAPNPIAPRALHHPDRAQLDLSAVLDALSDPTRREVVRRLAGMDEANCAFFNDCGSKPNMTYHLARLREAGLVQVRVDGARRWLSLRRADLDGRFPGLLAVILACMAAGQDAAATVPAGLA